MSKMDSLRAMREARYEQAKADARQQGRTAPNTTARPAPTQAPTQARPPAVAPAAAEEQVVDVESTDEELCGHRNMGGRTCTRERGHSAKSHRYS